MSELPDDYVTRPAAEKLDLLWELASATPYDEEALPRAVPGPWGRRHLFRAGYDAKSFTHGSDVLPAGREKLLHRRGACAKVRVTIEESRGFTGIFASGAEGLIRFSDAIGGPEFVPTLALKFPIDAGRSLNFFANPGEARSPKDRDFFSTMFSNSMPAPDGALAKLIAGRFEAASKSLGATRVYANYLPLHHLAGANVDGSAVDSPVVPDRLELRATKEARAAYREGVDFRLGLAALEPGTRVFEIASAPRIDAEAEPIGHLTLVTRVVASPFGDDRLFFQHDIGPTS